MTPENKIATSLPEPHGTGRIMNMNTLIVDCLTGEVKQCLEWARKDSLPCQWYNGLCRLLHPETGSDDPERYTVGVDCLHKDVTEVVEKAKAAGGIPTA